MQKPRWFTPKAFQQGRQILHHMMEGLRIVALLAVVGLVVYFMGSGIDYLQQDFGALPAKAMEKLLPNRQGVEKAWRENRTTLIEEQIPETIEVTVIGLSLAIGVGLTLAAIMDLLPPLRWVLYPLLVLSQTIPTFAIAILLLVVFGFGFGPKIVVVVLFCFYPITVSTLGGLRSVDNQHTALLRAMGASPLQIWWKVRLPTALPAFFSGLKLAATYSVVGTVIGEYVGAGDGIGKFLQRSYRSYQSNEVFLSILVITLLSIGLLLFVFIVERLALRWQYAGKTTRQRSMRVVNPKSWTQNSDALF